jgi:colanic acid/amylovoran biosynthesis protein
MFERWKQMSKYLIIPGCGDQNRGDQALVWETKRLAEDAGFVGKYIMIASTELTQSKSQGISTSPPVLQHPSRVFKVKNNIRYSWRLKLSWGVVAMADLLWSFLLLFRWFRALVSRLGNEEMRQKLQPFAEADAVFVKGGGFIHAYGGITSFYYVYYLLYHILLALSYGKKVYVMPNSFGPFRGLGVAWLVKYTLSRCTMVFARESISAEALSNVLQREVKVSPDVAFYLEVDDLLRESMRQWLESQGILRDGRKTIAITARPYRFPEGGDSRSLYDDYIKSLQRLAKALYSRGYFPVFVEHTFANNMHEDDSQCIREIVKGLDEREYAFIQERDFDCREMKALYSCFDFILATRFHSAIFAMSQNVPALVISYGGNKGEGIMRDMGLGEYVVPIHEVTFDVLLRKFESLVNNVDHVKAALYEHSTKLQLERRMLITEIATERNRGKTFE